MAFVWWSWRYKTIERPPSPVPLTESTSSDGTISDPWESSFVILKRQSYPSTPPGLVKPCLDTIREELALQSVSPTMPLFYDDDDDFQENDVASSPNLLQPRTAVGALVGSQERFSILPPPVHSFLPYVSDCTLDESHIRNDHDSIEVVLQNNNNNNTMANDLDLLARKAYNQRTMMEELFVAVTERIVDNTDLVQELQDNDNFQQITKFHDVALENITALLKELDNNLPEEFFLKSPTEIELYAQSHSGLNEALLFCKALLLQHTNNSAEGHWRLVPGMRAALGLQVETPPQRGHDTSIFSWPDDATPMTSNVSMTTTITTAHSSSLRLFQCGTQLRRTILTVSSLLHQLISACHDLKVQEIKQLHQQVLNLNPYELKSLVDAFELDGLLRAVSSDDSVILLPPMVTTTTRPTTILDSPRSRLYRRDQVFHERSSTFITSKVCQEPWEFDDLRRQMGSNDYDNDDDERRDTPADFYDPEERDDILSIYSSKEVGY